MPARHEILCITKVDRFNPYERITHIGGINRDTTNWRISQREAIKGIENGTWTFFVRKQGQSVDVIVATSRFGNKYIKTQGDGEEPNNLLSLKACRYS